MVSSALRSAAQLDSVSGVDGRGSLGEQAYQRIREDILFYQLPPGTRVSEAALTKRFSLRQAAVRSALARLTQDGLIEKTDERSARVAPLTLKDVREIYGVRLLLEPPAADFAAGAGVEAHHLERLRRISQSRYEVGSHVQLVDFLKANWEFNVIIASYCGNARLAALIGHLQDLTLRVLYVGIRSLNVSEWFQTTHLQIVDAIAAHDGAQAATLWSTDLRYGERLISEALMRLPELSEVNLGGASMAHLQRPGGRRRRRADVA
jgi:DNA-binding GntR family transcriptional regulator